MEIQLRRLRNLKGLSQEEMAEKLGIKTSRYGTWERGERMLSLAQAYDCAVALGCTLNELVGKEPDKATVVKTDSEQHLLSLYRSMDAHGRAMLVEQAEFLSARHPLNQEIRKDA